MHFKILSFYFFSHLLIFFQNPSFAQVCDQKTIEQALADLNHLKEQQSIAGIQNADLTYGMRKALILADLLFDADGAFVPENCQILKSYFVPKNPIHYEEQISNILDHLNTSWIPFFEKVALPEASNASANQVLQGLFLLPSHETLTPRHAKIAVLASLFAPLNQGPVGDCFAVSVLIRDHEKYYFHVAKDSAELIKKGFITREIDKKEDYFFFLPILADSDLENIISIDSSGLLSGTSMHFLSAPGFMAASSVMGFPDISKFSQKILKSLLIDSKNINIKITVSQIIDAIAQAVFTEQSKMDLTALKALGRYGFSCVTNNPVLRAVEDAFSAMAEDRPEDCTRSNINACVEQALASIWKKMGTSKSTQAFHQAFTLAFNQSYRLIYNASIPMSQTSADGSSNQGGFQLFKRDLSKPTFIGTQVITPTDFQSLVLNAVAIASGSLTQKIDAQNIANKLNDEILDGDFLQNALWYYDPNNRSENDPVKNYQNLFRTPMLSCDGDNPFEVTEIDTGKECDDAIQVYIPKNTQALITWCLNIAKSVPAGLYAMNSSQHAFNFDTTNSDLVSFVKSGSSADVWIRKIMTTPGMKVASKKIDAATKQALASGFHDYIAGALPSEKAYQILVNTLAKQDLTVQKYAARLLQGTQLLLLAPSEAKNELALIIDCILLRVLPGNDQLLLQQSTIQFAFTNWNEGTENLYFCAYFNPRTAQISFGLIDETKDHLQPMDEKSWVNNLPWQVLLQTIAPVEEAIGF